jgi:peptidyl-prolyl cis-trans isomerase SurA
MKYIFTALLCLLVLMANTQTIFSIGKTPVSKEEFLRAFGKNNTSNDKSEKAFREYLDLYTKFKLKVQAAYDSKLDTLPNQRAELQNFRSQIAESFMNDEGSMQLLVDEAFLRGQQDIRISHIYIGVDNGVDTARAFQKANEAYTKLNGGADFSAIAQQYSSDPSVAANKGDIGFISVFTLPYELENLAYNTSLNKISKPYRSRLGYHIFKKTEERAAAGKMKAAQILLAFPPDADNAKKTALKNLADSLYSLLQKGAAFNTLAEKYSNDNMTYQSGGAMPEFGVGRFDADFEKAIFAIAKDEEISKPILTQFGYHIVKRIGRMPVNTDKANADAMQVLKQAVQADTRMQVAKHALVKKIMATAGYKKAAYNEKAFMVYADSAYNDRKLPQLPVMNSKTLLFSFPKQKVTALDFSQYLKAIRASDELTKGKIMPQLLQQYTETVAMEYYKNNLELYNPAFANQVKEFKDGNLLFEVMQRQVWDKAPLDSNGLKKYYAENKNKYWWEPSADVILFTCTDSATAAKTKEAFLKNKNNWKSISDNSDGMVQSDSSRYELTQLPVNNAALIKTGYVSELVKSPTDNITTFVYVVKTYADKAPRNFEDAKGFVINDYQQYLEEKWVQQLKTKYPVKLNEPVLQSCWR